MVVNRFFLDYKTDYGRSSHLPVPRRPDYPSKDSLLRNDHDSYNLNVLWKPLVYHIMTEGCWDQESKCSPLRF